MALQIISQTSQGIQIGGQLTEAKRKEESVMAGRNAYFSALFQWIQVDFTTKSASLALQSAGQGAIPLYLRVVLWVAPPLLAFITKKQITNPALRKTLIFIQEHFGTLCHVIAAVSSVALIVFGSHIIGGVTLGLLAVGLLDRKGILPQRVRSILHEVMTPLLIATGLLSFEWIPTILAIASLVFLAVDKYFSWKMERDLEKRSVAQMEGPKNRLTYEDSFGIMNNPSDTKLSVEKDYIRYKTMPKIPEIDIDTLNNQFDQINWNEGNLRTLRLKLSSDERFKERNGGVTGKTDQQLIEFAKKSLATFIKSVKDKYIPSGEPKDYTLMNNYLKIIADRLQKLDNEVSKVDYLLQLAVQGGEYCGPGKFEVAEMVFEEITLSDETETDIRTKVLRILQMHRKHVLQKIYYEWTHANAAVRFMGKIIDWNDIHHFNEFLLLYGEQFGILMGSANNDATVALDPMTKMMIKPLLLYVNKVLWTNHTDSTIIKTIVEHIGSSALPKNDVMAWMQTWIERQPLSEEQKEKMKHDLLGSEEEQETLSDLKNKFRNESNETLQNTYHRRIDSLEQTAFIPLFMNKRSEEPHFDSRKGTRRYVVSENVVAAMLVDMGILNITDKSDWKKKAPNKEEEFVAT